MHDEDAFLQKLLENPADDTLRMVYADWLDERGGDESRAKAQFLRVTVRLMGPIRRIGWRSARHKELHQLAALLPPAWLAVTSRLKIEGCADARARLDPDELAQYGIRFNVVCDKRWDELTATDDATVRHCGTCKQNVHFCDTIEAARARAWRGECVAVSLGVIRHGKDLEVPTMVGSPSVIEPTTSE
jgi:uncharacterized protein (TIGR02996 family)